MSGKSEKRLRRSVRKESDKIKMQIIFKRGGESSD